MMKFLVTWLLSITLVVGGLALIRHNMDSQFLVDVQEKMVVDMSESRLDTIECSTMTHDECQWVRQMLFSTITSPSADDYRTLIAEHSEPAMWSKETTIAIESAYQGAIRAGSGADMTSRMVSIEKHFKLRSYTVNSSIIFVLLITLIVGRAWLKEREQ